MPDSPAFSGPIVWKPNKDYFENARLTEFMRAHHIDSFEELVARSTQDVAWFTDAVFKFLDIRFYAPYSKVVGTLSIMSTSPARSAATRAGADGIGLMMTLLHFAFSPK